MVPSVLWIRETCCAGVISFQLLQDTNDKQTGLASRIVLKWHGLPFHYVGRYIQNDMVIWTQSH